MFFIRRILRTSTNVLFIQSRILEQGDWYLNVFIVLCSPHLEFFFSYATTCCLIATLQFDIRLHPETTITKENHHFNVAKWLRSTSYHREQCGNHIMFNIIDTRVNALDAKINAYFVLFRYDYSRNKGLLILENGASYLIGSYIANHLVFPK